MESVVTSGTGQRAKALGRPVAGKTGTTNDMKDAWFIGYVPQLIAGVWVGYDQERSLGAGGSGGQAAAPIWTGFMQPGSGEYTYKDVRAAAGCFLCLYRPYHRAACQAGATEQHHGMFCGRDGTDRVW